MNSQYTVYRQEQQVGSVVKPIAIRAILLFKQSKYAGIITRTTTCDVPIPKSYYTKLHQPYMGDFHQQ